MNKNNCITVDILKNTPSHQIIHMNTSDAATNKKTPQYILTSDLMPGVDASLIADDIKLHPEKIEKILQKDPNKFTTVLAHEIRNPLTNINLSIQLIENEMKNEALNIYVDIIKRSSLRINELLNEVLKYHPDDKVSVENYCIHQLLDEVLEMTRDSIALKNITVKSDYSEQHCRVTMNRSKMKIALTNIIINAIDAMVFHKGILTLITTTDNDSFTLRIKDNGCGINKKNLKRIFKPYFTNKPGGIGLGLSATYQILASNNIGITVESVEGEGTSFILVFNKRIEPGNLSSLKLFAK
jgi:signal transduction histidine kinase